ncbi:MAG TPA: STAS domain-containing protein [Fluviicola sp.]|nr:STAS domain-containing protein [Fluviicola sp.]
MQLTFDITVLPTHAVLKLSGRILSDEGLAEVLAKVETAIAAGSKNWLCDLGELSYCNSTGLNLFVRILTKSRSAGGDCALANLQPGVQKLFELSKLNEIFTSYASTQEATERYNTIS